MALSLPSPSLLLISSLLIKGKSPQFKLSWYIIAVEPRTADQVVDWNPNQTTNLALQITDSQTMLAALNTLSQLLP